ncbi:MAG: hypothetical protein LBD55_10650 [Treponema sp.]|nr:hypothetical protein [Treponema sp.]
MISHEQETNDAFENMKALAHTDPDDYKKEFMQGNYKGHHAASDILSGLRQILTGEGGVCSEFLQVL